MRILLVEDDIETSDMLKDFLITENFEVVTAYDGKSACKKFYYKTIFSYRSAGKDKSKYKKKYTIYTRYS